MCLLVPPTVSVSPTELTSFVGESAVTFLCTVNAFPAPIIAWLVNGSVLDISSEGVIDNTTINVTTTVSNLTLLVVDLDDIGNYSCFAENSLAIGAESSAEAMLFVLRKWEKMV